ncbi:hypothetical protein C6A90_13915 [Proteus mirabilis]|nr:hypothetical protein C6A90_13915 [Proteus mirabilis]
MKVDDICRQNGISSATYYIYGLPPFCKYRICFLGCCLHQSGIRKTCAQMSNSHTIASTTGRSLRPI